MRKAGARENRQLLSPHQGIEPVDDGYARLDELAWIVARGRVQRLSVDVHALFGDHGRAAVLRAAHAVKNTAQHIHGNGQLNAAAQEAGCAGIHAQAAAAFKQLHQGSIAADLQDAPAPDPPIRLADLHQLVIGNARHMVHQHQRPDQLFYGAVFFKHPPSLPD